MITYREQAALSDATGRRLTYADLDRESALLAERLIRAGVTAEDRVGIHRARDVELVVSVLGVLRAGAAYVCVDDRYPRARREFMLRAASARITVIGADDPQLSSDIELFDWSMGQTDVGDQRASTSPVLPMVSGAEAACVLFTSGSTGTPKGVVLEHRNIVHFATNLALPTLTCSDRVAQISNVSFDAFHFELWCALAAGAELVMLPSLQDMLRSDLGRELRRHRISVMLAPTMAFNHIAAEDPEAFARLRVLHTGGDVIRPASCRALLGSGFNGILCNLYGPTEGTTAATIHRVDEVLTEVTSVSIGTAVAGAWVRVLDERLRDVPPGSVGELYIGGAGVARGYLRDAEKTAERFVPDESGPPGSLLYATGDLVIERAGGALDYVGRADGQVKIRGYRVEPREVEYALLTHPEVGDVAVLVRGDGHDRTLVAFVVVAGSLVLSDLRRYVERILPDYQVPAEFVVVPQMPATTHGKRDDQALFAFLEDRDRSRSRYHGPRTDAEIYLAGVWGDLVGVEQVSVTDDFFAIGGHSMLAFRMARRVSRERSVPITVVEVLENPVLAELALVIDRLRAPGVDP